MAATININVGILGHVDSGKTSLVRALSTHLSTAALDKHPQSQARGITLDLGFSSFTVDAPSRLSCAPGSKLQFTLVDHPGHASLIRTIIGGAQIMDMAVLVVDAVKGIQTQTAECLVVAEITTDALVVVLNKVDLLPAEGRAAAVERAAARVRKVLGSTKFAGAAVLPLSAAPGGGGKMGAAAPLAGGGAADGAAKAQSPTVAPLVEHLLAHAALPARNAGGPFLFSIDHCFTVKGQGTVLTGTVIAGSLALGEPIELPALGQEKKVKGLQVFRQPVAAVRQGDRAGVCVAGLDAALVERGVACTPGSVPRLTAAVALVKRIRFFKGPLPSGCRVHVSVGHETVMATATFFGGAELAAAGVGRAGRTDAAMRASAAADADAAEEVERAGGEGGGGAAAPPPPQKPAAAAAAAQLLAADRSHLRGTPSAPLKWGSAWLWQDALMGGRRSGGGGDGGSGGGGGGGEGGTTPAAAAAAADGPIIEWQYAALQFDSAIYAPIGSLVIGSRLDSDIHAPICRLAFFGALDCALPPPPGPEHHPLRCLRLYKRKLKRGVVDRVEAGSGGSGTLDIVGKGLFKKEGVDMNQFAGLRVHTRAGQAAVIEGAFGKAGKFKASFLQLSACDGAVVAALLAEGAIDPPAAGAEGASGGRGGAGGSGGSGAPLVRPGHPLFLRYKKYVFGAGAGSDAKAVDRFEQD
jgi:selenocysteine-specific elongation factor